MITVFRKVMVTDRLPKRKKRSQLSLAIFVITKYKLDSKPNNTEMWLTGEITQRSYYYTFSNLLMKRKRVGMTDKSIHFYKKYVKTLKTDLPYQAAVLPPIY